MTIFDLPALSADECFKLIRTSLEIHPDLLRIFDEATIADLVRRRRAFDNALLLRLVQPGDDAANNYWRDVVSDLKVLEDEGAFEEFRYKLRRYKPTDVEQARTELWFPAWLRRNGEKISLEPEVRDGRKCEFVLLSSPTTWWEIKTPLDLPHILAQAAVEIDVHRRLRYIPQPFVLSLHKVNLPLDAAPKVVKSIKKQISDFYAAGGSPPAIFRESCMINGTLENDALVVGVDTTTKRERGYLGTLLGKEQIFQGENAARVVKRVLAAAEQIPKSGGGVTS